MSLFTPYSKKKHSLVLLGIWVDHEAMAAMDRLKDHRVLEDSEVEKRDFRYLNHDHPSNSYLLIGTIVVFRNCNCSYKAERNGGVHIVNDDVVAVLLQMAALLKMGYRLLALHR